MYRPATTSDGLGVLPLLIYGGAVVAGAAATVGARALNESWTDGWLRAFRQAYGGTPDPLMRPAPAPQFQPPPAPQTAGKMANWNPADLLEASAQRSAQFATDSNYLREVMAESSSRSAGGSGTDGFPWWLVAVAGVVAVMFVRKA